MKKDHREDKRNWKKLFIVVASTAGAASCRQVPGPCRNQLREGGCEVREKCVVALEKNYGFVRI